MTVRGRVLRAFFASTLAALLLLPIGVWSRPLPTFDTTISRVTAMPRDHQLRQRAGQHGLHVLNVLWEDTARASGSSIGPNISDLTLQVHEPLPGARSRQHLLPVLRFPNFADETADIPADSLWVRVGNHGRAGSLEAVRLTDVLSNLGRYLSDPRSLAGGDNFLARRDTHFLVSAQHVFLPIPAAGKVEFNPVVFNYQSSPGDPAVLVLLVTREGTSVQVVENRGGLGGSRGHGQQLFFNNAGQRTLFTAERRSAVEARVQAHGVSRPEDVGALDEGSDMMMIVQVPLKHRNRGRLPGLTMESSSGPPKASGMRRMERSVPEHSDVENAVLGHGEDLGPFIETNGLRLERDDRFPIRVTVQFYRATSNGVVSDEDLRAVRDDIRRVYNEADYVGSLVVPREPRHRPTDWIRDHPREAAQWQHVPGPWRPFLPRPTP